MMALLANISLSPSSDLNTTLATSLFPPVTPQQAKSFQDKDQQLLITTSPTSKNNQVKQQLLTYPTPAPVQEEEELNIMTQIGSFFKSLIFNDPSPIPSNPTPARDNWQANYLSPVHTKLKKEGRIQAPEKEKDVEWLLKNHFKGILPYYRLWEIKMEEMDADIPTVGRGTPPFPNRPIFHREMIATKLFLKDYGKRRGLINQTNKITEEAMDVRSLRKNGAGSKPSFSTMRTQTLAPEEVIKRKKSISISHRASSKLIS